MKSLLTKISVCFCAVLFWSLSVNAQIFSAPSTIRPNSNSTSNPNSLPCFSDKEIDLNAEQFPPKFHGNNLGTVIDEIKRRNELTKDEFETTKQFEERKATENRKPLIGNLNYQSLFSTQAKDVNLSYDADSEIMSAKVAVKPLGRAISSCGEHENVLGLVFTLFSEIRKNLSNYEDDDDENSISSYKIEYLAGKFKLELSIAKQTKPNLRALYVIKIVSRDDQYIPLTRIYDYSLRSEKYINAEIKEIWIYDITTGKIWEKLKPNIHEEPIIPAQPKISESEKERSIKKAEEFYKAGQDDEALSELRQLLFKDSMNAKAYFLVGKIHLRRGDLEAAVSNLKTAVLWKNDLIEGHIQLGKIFLERGDFNMATTYAKNALQLDANNPEAVALIRQIERRTK